MITKELYNNLREGYGSMSSWAIWANPSSTQKAGVDDLSVFNPPPLDVLHTDYVLMGLNISSEKGGSQGNWSNFHKTKNDRKLAYALYNTKLWGCYVTDFFKGHANPAGHEVVCYMKQHPDEANKQACNLLTELSNIKPRIIICLGEMAYAWMKKYVPKDSYEREAYKVLWIYHYSAYKTKRGAIGSARDYRNAIHKQLKEQLGNDIVKP